MDSHPPKRSDLLLTLTIIGCVASGILAIVGFIVYVRTRLADRTEDPRYTPAQHARRLAELDRRERQSQSFHFITLFIFVLLGVLLLIQLSNRLNR